VRRLATLAVLCCACGSPTTGSNALPPLDATTPEASDAGCVATAVDSGDDAGVFVFTVGVVNPSSADGGLPCTYAANPTPPLIASGLLDIALRDEYDALYVLGNRSIPQKVGPDSAFVVIESATVRITSSTGSPLASYTRFIAGTLRPTSDCQLGQDLLGPVIIVDANTISKDPEIQNLLAPPTVPASVTA